MVREAATGMIDVPDIRRTRKIVPESYPRDGGADLESMSSVSVTFQLDTTT
jgi:hypothetical protein